MPREPKEFPSRFLSARTWGAGRGAGEEGLGGGAQEGSWERAQDLVDPRDPEDLKTKKTKKNNGFQCFCTKHCKIQYFGLFFIKNQ